MKVLIQSAIPCLLAAAFFPAVLMAGNDANSSAQALAKAELIALDDAWVDAEVRGDRVVLEQLLDEAFLVTLASGRTLNRTEFIDYFDGEDMVPFTVTHDVIRVFGDMALVLDLSESGRTKFTWIALRREGRWRVVSETISRVEYP